MRVTLFFLVVAVFTAFDAGFMFNRDADADVRFWIKVVIAVWAGWLLVIP